MTVPRPFLRGHVDFSLDFDGATSENRPLHVMDDAERAIFAEGAMTSLVREIQRTELRNRLLLQQQQQHESTTAADEPSFSYLVDAQWYASWRADPHGCGRIDNSVLLRGDGTLRWGLSFDDVEILTPREWASFVSKYGGGPALPRCRLPGAIELYPLEMRVSVLGNERAKQLVVASRHERWKSVKMRCLELFGYVTPSTPWQPDLTPHGAMPAAFREELCALLSALAAGSSHCRHRPRTLPLELVCAVGAWLAVAHYTANARADANAAMKCTLFVGCARCPRWLEDDDCVADANVAWRQDVYIGVKKF